MKESAHVFLGGACGASKWREELIIPRLTCTYFNPVVPDWTEECYQNELRHRELDDICLYVLSPKTKGLYSIAEVIDDSNKRPEKTAFFFLKEDGDSKYTQADLKSLDKIGEMVKRNGGAYFKDIDALIAYLNQ